MKKLLIVSLSVTMLFLLKANFSNAQGLMPVTEYFNTNSPGRHYYATNTSVTNQAPTGSGWVTDGVIGYLSDWTALQPTYFIYEFYKSGTNSYYYTNDINRHPVGYVNTAIIGAWIANGFNSAPVYEYYNDGDYYYSTSPTTPTGYVYDGIAFYVYTNQH